MKSIMQEGSSVTKAIEQAWTSAGKPKEFSVRVFEEAQKNFIGMTVKPAKVAIFFQEPRVVNPTDAQKTNFDNKNRTKDNAPRQTQPQPRAINPRHERNPEQANKPQRTFATEDTEKVNTEPRIMWTDEMVNAAQEWLKSSFSAMEKSNINFSTNVNQYHLRFTVDKPVLEDKEKEQQLFKSFSFLMMQALKKQFRRPLRGFKIILVR